ncbi:MAG: FHA domain-containing protein [Bradymonadales bacterium]|nr:FHA domain-containing protein [Bradymonadales bacterium]
MSACKCRHCGASIPEGHQFCGSCGRPRRFASSGAEDTLFFGPLQTPGRAKLIVIRAEGQEGLSYALNATEHVAGRSSGVILFPDDPFLSARHAVFRYRDNKLFLADLSSLNGSYLRIREPVHLADGDLFSCGQQLLQVNLLDPRAETPTPDGTLHYLSPDRKERLRVTQILEGQIPGRMESSALGEMTIGREGCDLTIPEDSHLSRRHAKVTLERDGRIQLCDLGSKNGTFLRLKGEVRLIHGDYLFMGRVLLRVEIIE